MTVNAKMKLGFLSSSIPRPLDEKEEDFEKWSMCNDMVHSWLLNDFTLELAQTFSYSKIASNLWSNLMDKFDVSNGPLLFQLKRKIVTCTQGTDNIIVYNNRITKLQSEYDAYRKKTICIHFRENEDERLIELFMGLKDSFLYIREHILLMNPLPSMNKAYPLVIDLGRRTTRGQPQVF